MFPIKITKILGNFCCPEGLVQTGAPLVVSGWLPHSERPFVDAVSGKFCGHRCPVHLWLGNSATYISYYLFTIYFLGGWTSINRGPKHRPQPGGGAFAQGFGQGFGAIVAQLVATWVPKVFTIAAIAWPTLTLICSLYVYILCRTPTISFYSSRWRDMSCFYIWPSFFMKNVA
jgi:hypothetical protein